MSSGVDAETPRKKSLLTVVLSLHQNILGREKAMLSGETGHIRGIEWTGEAGDGHQVRGCFSQGIYL